MFFQLKIMIDISNRFYKAATKHLCRDISFFSLLELVQEEDSQLFIEASLEGIDMKKKFLYFLVSTWTFALKFDRPFLDKTLSTRAYAVIKHLFEKENFLELCDNGFKDLWDIISHLKWEEEDVHELAGPSISSQFESLYAAIIRRCQVSLTNTICSS